MEQDSKYVNTTWEEYDFPCTARSTTNVSGYIIMRFDSYGSGEVLSSRNPDVLVGTKSKNWNMGVFKKIENVDLHKDTASFLFNIVEEDISNEQRWIGKIFNLVCTTCARDAFVKFVEANSLNEENMLDTVLLEDFFKDLFDRDDISIGNV